MSRAKITLSLLASLVLASFVGCAHRNDSSAAAPEQAKAAEPAAKPIPKGHPFAKITQGMTDAEVHKILGEPTNRHEYPTGKAAIPWYYGDDVWRSDWIYKGKGHIVFSRGRSSSSLTVIEVIYDPST